MDKNNIFQTIDMRYTYYTEVSIGILANAFLLLFHIFTFFLQHRPKPTDLPIGLLALIHLMMLSVGIKARGMFESQGIWNDFMCKTIFYSYRTLRGLSLCTTCLLSVLQAITLSPRSSWLAKFKQTSTHHNLCSLLILCFFYMSISSHLLTTIIATPNFTSESLMYVTDYCSVRPMSYSLRQTVSALVSMRDVFLTGLMALASAYMLTLLCRHRRQSRHLHGTSPSPRASPELRATRTILLLLCFFMVMSILDCFISSSRVLLNNSQILYSVHTIVAYSYATMSPLVFISTEKRIITFWKTNWGGGSQCFIVLTDRVSE
ncbi:vomeronasal type-1 receptor 48-like [Ochotona curzoniae]|uniref:vomeronasal type-1 receptor 48-like n=1 Tax=Ochotona curzoniae TaxID=130825 RepID=UPI001B3502F7|nr:vomeronasal type-1 receptor 48-like [Ochotona curzoniae]